MKILYGVVGEGMGHATRSKVTIEHLIAKGHSVKIVVSGGFDLGRIRAFEEDGVPVDAYGVGASAHEGSWDLTADVVQLDGKPQGKAGRELRPNPRLERVK
jgi:nicotinate phosphoribosyltransferase